MIRILIGTLMTLIFKIPTLCVRDGLKMILGGSLNRYEGLRRSLSRKGFKRMTYKIFDNNIIPKGNEKKFTHSYNFICRDHCSWFDKYKWIYWVTRNIWGEVLILPIKIADGKFLFELFFTRETIRTFCHHSSRRIRLCLHKENGITHPP